MSAPTAVTVLFVEHSHVLRERLVRLVLGRTGVAVSAVVGLRQALGQLTRFTFDVLVVGIDTSSWHAPGDLYRLRTAAPVATLVALTADAEPETIAACRAQGADVVLPIGLCFPRLATLLAAKTAERAARCGG